MTRSCAYLSDWSKMKTTKTIKHDKNAEFEPLGNPDSLPSATK